MPILRKVLPGDAIEPSASVHNAMVDAALAHKRGAVRSTWVPPPVASSPGIVLVRNDSGANVGRAAVLGIDGVVIAPDVSVNEFQNRPLISGVSPTDPDHVGKFVVTMEPIPAAKIGRAVIDGIVACQIQVFDDAAQFAGVLDAEPDHLVQRGDGSASILWHEGIVDPGDVVWGLVALGVSGGSRVAEITAINSMTFSCKWHDENGDVIGDAFTVYIVSLPVIDGCVGKQDPADCDPKRAVGDLLRIEHRTQYVGGGDYVAGWWAVPEFTLFDCTVECP